MSTVFLVWLVACVTVCVTPSLVYAFGINLIKVQEDDPSQVICTIALLRKYFHSGEALSGSLLSVSITSASALVQLNLLRAIHLDNETWSVVVKNGREPMPETTSTHILHEKPQSYFVVVENLENEDLEDVFEVWKTNVNWNPLAQFVVYLATIEETDEGMTELMIEILLHFMNKKIFNVNVIGQNEENGFYYGKTVFPYHPDNNCGNRVITIKTLDICEYQDIEKDGKGDDEQNVDEENYFDETRLEFDKDSEENFFAINKDGKKGGKGKTAGDDEREIGGNVTEADNKCEIGVKIGESHTDSNEEESEDGKEDNRNGCEDGLKNKDEEAPNDDEYVVGDNDDIVQNISTVKLHLEEMFPALFLDKFPKDLSGCPLVAAYRSWEPYIFNEAEEDDVFNEKFEINDPEMDENRQMYVYDENNGINVAVNKEGAQTEYETDKKSSMVKLSGIEYKMVETIGERLHINIDLQVENSNLYHLFQKLIDGDIEMIVGGIDEDPSISQFVSSTVPYHQDDLTWCVAKASRKHKLFNFLASFQPVVWLLTFVFVVVTALNVVLITRLLRMRLWYLQDYVSISMRVLGIIFSQSVKLQHLPSALKVNFASAFFMSLMFINVYQSFLVSTLTNPKSTSQISHLEEIYLHRMSIMGSVENVRHLNKEGEIFKYVRQKFQMCYDIEQCLRRAAHDDQLAVTVSRQHSFYNPRIPRDRLYCFDRDENMYVYLVTMLLPKKFHLLHKINPVIQHVIESGHMEKWARDLDMKRKIREEIRLAQEEQFKSLSLAQVIGTFVFGAILILNAIWVFLLEHWVYWMIVKRKTRLKPVRYLHRKFGHIM